MSVTIRVRGPHGERLSINPPLIGAAADDLDAEGGEWHGSELAWFLRYEIVQLAVKADVTVEGQRVVATAMVPVAAGIVTRESGGKLRGLEEDLVALVDQVFQDGHEVTGTITVYEDRQPGIWRWVIGGGKIRTEVATMTWPDGTAVS